MNPFRTHSFVLLTMLAAALLASASGCAPGTGAPGTPDQPVDTRIVGATGQEADLAAKGLPTPIMAQCGDLQLHCAVKAKKLTEILFHNSVSANALPLTTELEEGDTLEALHKGTGWDRKGQPTGDEWMHGQYLHTTRAGRQGPDMSAIDCGAVEGTTVYAPVSGTVANVRKYKLYGHADYCVHIRPLGYDDLDVTLIHLTDPKVAKGDNVVAGLTPVAKVRDVFAYIGQQMELKSYTPLKDKGNHTHIQVNDATSPAYRKASGLD